MSARIVLHSLERSRSQRILWLMEELQLPYSIKTYKRDPTGRAAPEMKQIHALGKSPILTVTPPNGPQRVLAESAVMMEYLLDHFGDGRMVPRRYVDGREGEVGGESESWLRYRYFMHYTEGSLMPLMVTQILMDVIKNIPAPFFVKPVTGLVPKILEKEYCKPNYATHFGFLENQLETSPDKGTYLTGTQFTAADILISYPLIIAQHFRAIDQERYPRLIAYLEALQTVESYKRAVQKLEEVEEQPYKPF